MQRNRGFPALPPPSSPPARENLRGRVQAKNTTDGPLFPPRARSPLLPETPASRPRGSARSPGPRGARPLSGPPPPRGLRSSSLLPPSLLLLHRRRLLLDSSRRILHVNNIQALFTVAAGRRRTHASTLDAGGGGGKASAQHLHTHPAPPRRSPPGGRAGRPGLPASPLTPQRGPRKTAEMPMGEVAPLPLGKKTRAR